MPETERIVSTANDVSGGGLSERAHPHMAPTPASASLWPTLPAKGGGTRKHRASLMNVVSPQQLKLKIDDASEVSALLLRPSTAQACFVFAHGAGAGMTHEFMERVSFGLFERNVATLRYQFPYMERRAKRPDSPALAHATVRAAAAQAARLASNLPLIAGGKSFGGRKTSQAVLTSRIARAWNSVTASWSATSNNSTAPIRRSTKKQVFTDPISING